MSVFKRGLYEIKDIDLLPKLAHKAHQLQVSNPVRKAFELFTSHVCACARARVCVCVCVCVQLIMTTHGYEGKMVHFETLYK